MKYYRTAALILASSLFFPVSCTTALIAGTNFFALSSAKNSLQGQKPYEMVYLVASLPGTQQKLEAIRLSLLDDYKQNNPQASFLLPDKSGGFAIGSDGAKITYVATSPKPGTQIIEVTHDGDGEMETFFRYEATDKTIKPMYSKLWHIGFMTAALPFALAFAFILHFIGWIMKKMISKEEASKNGVDNEK